MNKAHSPINWENYPNETTPINESNLNKMDRAIGIIDDRVIEQETKKLSKADASSDIVNVEYDKDTSVFQFTKRNGEIVEVDVSSVVDSELSYTSTNPVQNKVVTREVRRLSEEIVDLENGTYKEELLTWESGYFDVSGEETNDGNYRKTPFIDATILFGKEIVGTFTELRVGRYNADKQIIDYRGFGNGGFISNLNGEVFIRFTTLANETFQLYNVEQYESLKSIRKNMDFRVDVENPHYFIDGIVGSNPKAFYRFDSITYCYNGNVVTKPFSDMDVDTHGYYYTEYDFSKTKGVYMVQKALSEYNQLAINPITNKFELLRSDVVTDKTIICIDRNTHRVSGRLVDLYHKEQFDDMLNAQNTIPNDVIEQLNAKEETLYSQFDDNNFVFGYCSDVHTFGFEKGVETDLTTLALNRFDKHIDFDCIINTGDSVLSDTAYANDGSAYIALKKSVFKTDRNKTLYCEGNHDRNIYDPVMPIKDFVNLMYRTIKKDSNVHFGKSNGAYYYKDFPKHKIRVVVLTLYDVNGSGYNGKAGYKQDQMDWLVNTALQVSEDYHIIVATHSAPIELQDNDLGLNSNVLVGILESFVNGTSTTINSSANTTEYTPYTITTNFTRKGNLIGLFSGHTHVDDLQKVNGVNYLCIECGYVEARDLSNREGFTYSAIAFDVVIVDTDNRIVSLKRVGYGNDRSFTY